MTDAPAFDGSHDPLIDKKATMPEGSNEYGNACWRGWRAPGLPHHVTQAGNRRQKTFFNEGDYAEYRRSLALIPHWAAFIGQADAPDFGDRVHAHARTGRPVGPESFVESLERALGRSLKRSKPGPKPREQDHQARDLFDG